jgi:LacI family transcriptional regulator
MSTESITLKELARRAAVHPSTVSRVANNDPMLRIAPATRARIDSLLRETQYRPNGVARGLKLRQTFVLAVLIPDITNPLFAAIYRGVEDAAGQRGYSVILSNTDGSRDRERSLLQVLRARQVDGVVVASSYLRDPAIEWLREQGIPHVLVNRFSHEQADPFVGSDDAAGGRLATEHLLSLGHRFIAHLCGPRTVSTAVLRRRGYRDALAAAGMAEDPRLIVESGFTEEGGMQAAETLLAGGDPPTAIFAVNDMAAVGAYTVAQRQGIRIPGQLAVVGYNDVPLAARLHPPLTTVHIPLHEFGTVSAGLLIEQIEDGSVKPRRVLFAPQLSVRGSTQS